MAGVCPYRRVVILPGSWAGVLEPCRPVFARRGTFVVFTVLATGMVAATGRRSVVGMLAGARMTQQISFHAALLNSSGAIILFIYTGRQRTATSTLPWPP